MPLLAQSSGAYVPVDERPARGLGATPGANVLLVSYQGMPRDRPTRCLPLCHPTPPPSGTELDGLTALTSPVATEEREHRR
jgi:hypothetical protein